MSTVYRQPNEYKRLLISNGIMIGPSPEKNVTMPIALVLFSLKNEFNAKSKAGTDAASPIAEIVKYDIKINLISNIHIIKLTDRPKYNVLT